MSGNLGPIDNFPTVWLTYRERLKLDLKKAWGEDASDLENAYFDDDYLKKISDQAKQLDDTLIKLMVLQIALTSFQVIGFLGGDASISLFGITLKQAAGVKEMILALYATVVVATWIVLVSRDTCLTVRETLIELETDENYANFEKIAGPTPFNVKIFIPRIFDQWVFPTFLNKLSLASFMLVGLVLFAMLMIASVYVNYLFFRNIYLNPTLGKWSNVVLCYVSIVVLFGGLFLLRFYVPLPHRDQRILLELMELERVDKGLHRRKLDEVYGPNSKYRKKRRWARFKSRFKRS